MLFRSYGGMVRKKNILSVLMQSFFGAALFSVVWIVIGYSLTFTEGNAFIGGFDKVLLKGVEVASLSGTIPETVLVMFQCTFAIITPIVIMGGAAERMKFSAAMVFLTLWLLAVYIPTAHMVWGPGGFMAAAGVLDFAGGTVGHINSGVAALVATLMVGKRIGTGSEAMLPHNLVLTMIGGALLWVGWFGFNAGSALAAGGNAGIVMINTHAAASSAAVTWVVLEWVLRGKPSLLGAVSGAIAGLVVITPSCGYVTVGSALRLGVCGGAVCYWAVGWLKQKLGYDDALDVFGVHGIGGILGAILTGVFTVTSIGGKPGLLEGNVDQFLLQLEGAGITAAWCAFATFVILKLVDLTMGLRVDREVEIEGLDFAEHGEALH